MIRLARRDDLPRLAAVERSAAAPFSAYPEVAAVIAASGTLPEAELAAAHVAGLLWVADAGEPVGFLAAGLLDGALFIHELSVAAAAQGAGHGRALLDAAIAEARRRMLPAVALTTFDAVPWNRPWYERVGFRPVDPCLPALADRLAAERAFWDPHGWTRCAMLLPLA